MMGRFGATGRSAYAAFAIALILSSAAVSCSGAGGGDDDADDLDGGLDGADGSPLETEHSGDTHGALDASTSVASAVLSSTSLVFPSVSCGGAQTDELSVANKGSGPLMISASIAGSGFLVTPAELEVAPGKSGALTVRATVPSSATAGVPIAGALTLATNDPIQTQLVIGLSATPTGPTLAILPDLTFAFPSGAVGTPASPQTLTLSNTGNAPATFTFDAPGSPFSLSLDGPDGGPLAVTAQTAVILNAGATWTATAGFTPSSTTLVTATSNITTPGATCGTSESSIFFSGEGAVAAVTGWPSTIDFGPAVCGGAAPPNQTFMLTNSTVVNAFVTTVSLAGAPGFSANVKVGRAIPATFTVSLSVEAPPVPANSPVTPITAALTMETDVDTSAHVITLTEEPTGAILAFDTSVTPNFGSFGSVMLLESATQYFDVVNSGSAPATVALAASGDGATDASSPFSLSPSVFTLEPGSAQVVSATFTPVSASEVPGSIAMTAATGSICGALPASIALSGSGLGGGLTITPSSLLFSATCGGAAPGEQSFMVRNDGTANLTWTMTGPTGPGAKQYSVAAFPGPGLLIPGAFATVNVTAQAIPSPAPNPSPSAFAAQLTITTDIPLDTPHVVWLGEPPLGDQLSFSTPSPLRFGEIPVDTNFGQMFTIANNANAGSPPASVSFFIGGSGAAAYVTPATILGLAAGATASENISFSPTSDAQYPATLSAVTTDALCTPPPPPLALTGAGM